MGEQKITFGNGRKFDLQLSTALIHERRLAEIFTASRIERVELKTETWQWERTGNICIEYAHNGEPSGIAATDADYWVHELRRDGRTLVYLMFPAERLKELVVQATIRGDYRVRSGDGGRSAVAIIPLRRILK